MPPGNFHSIRDTTFTDPAKAVEFGRSLERCFGRFAYRQFA